MQGMDARVVWWSTFVMLNVGILAFAAKNRGDRREISFLLLSLLLSIAKFFQYTHPEWGKVLLDADGPLSRFIGLAGFTLFLSAFMLVSLGWWWPDLTQRAGALIILIYLGVLLLDLFLMLGVHWRASDAPPPPVARGVLR